MTCKKLMVLYHFFDVIYTINCQWKLKVKIDAYQTYVRPILEYEVTTWTLHTQRYINKLEGKICYVRFFNLYSMQSLYYV